MKAGFIIIALSLAVLATAAVSASAAATTTSTTSSSSSRMQRAAHFVQHWEDAGAMPKHSLLPITVAVVQGASMQRMEDACMAVSQPGSASYGRYLSLEQVAQLAASPADSMQAVLGWLQGPLGASAVTVSATRDAVQALVPVHALESSMRVQLHLWRAKADAGITTVRSLAPYRLPAAVAAHVDVILGVSDLLPPAYDAKTKAKTKTRAAAKQPASAVVAAASAPSKTFVPAPIMGPNENMFWNRLSLSVTVPCPTGGFSETAWPKCNNTAMPIVAFQVNVTSESGETQSYMATPTELHGVSVYGSAGNMSSTAMINLAESFNASATPLVYWHRYTFTIASVAADGTISQAAHAPYIFPAAPADYKGFMVVPQQIAASVEQLYNLPPVAARAQAASGNSQGVVEWGTSQSYSPEDLAHYAAFNGLPANVTKLVKVHGNNNPLSPGGEASLDVQTILAVSPGVETTFWVSPWSNTVMFLGWAMAAAADPSAPLVSSISYSLAEHLVPEAHASRMNAELLKMCQRGLTVLVSSGDGGALDTGHDGSADQCTDLRPQWPASSPWVLSVGATIPCPECAPKANSVGEAAASMGTGARYTTGGGFTTLETNRRPGYQAKAVQQFVSQHGSTLPTGMPNFNATGRAFPDVASLGVAVRTIQGGLWYESGGTSAATPIWGGMVALLNNARLAAGKPAVGFINPALYALAEKQPSLFYDVTVGNTNWGQAAFCPLADGYQSVTGWDAVTGLGTVADFKDLNEAIMGLV